MVPKEFEHDIIGFSNLIQTELNIYGKNKNIPFSCGNRVDQGAIISCGLRGTHGYSDVFPVFINHDTHRLTSYPEPHFTVRRVMTQVPWQWVFPATQIYWEEYNKSVKIANKYMDILNLEYGPNFVAPVSLYEKYDDCLTIWQRGVMNPDNIKWRDGRIKMMQLFLLFVCFGLGWIMRKNFQKNSRLGSCQTSRKSICSRASCGTLSNAYYSQVETDDV